MKKGKPKIWNYPGLLVTLVVSIKVYSLKVLNLVQTFCKQDGLICLQILRTV